MADKTENQALADVLAENLKPQVINHAGIELLIHPKNQSVTDLKEITEKYQAAPDRRVGEQDLGRTESFIEFTNRYKTDDLSVIMARGVVVGHSIDAHVKAIFNPDPAGPDQTKAGHGDFSAFYEFPVSKELAAWLEKDGTFINQGEFARFIEDRIIDMIDPLFASNKADLERVLSGKAADPINMLELSRGLEVRVKEQVKNAGRLQSGEMQLTYSVDHEGTDGQPLKVPSWFIINIPVFEGDKPYEIAVRLRYRLKEGQVSWAYEIFRLEKTFDTAFTETVKYIQENTKLPVFFTA